MRTKNKKLSKLRNRLEQILIGEIISDISSDCLEINLPEVKINISVELRDDKVYHVLLSKLYYDDGWKSSILINFIDTDGEKRYGKMCETINLAYKHVKYVLKQDKEYKYLLRKEKLERLV